ncbi:PP2C family protein-serine/threonine phosphatase [Roseibium sp. M-1]
MRFLICGRQTQGGREYQEDSWSLVTADGSHHLNANEDGTYSSDGNALVVLSDGIGSGGHGDIASQVIVGGFARHLQKVETVAPEDMLAALTAVDANLGQLKQENGYGESMGGTVVAGLFRDNALTFLSVGDSHLLRFRDDEIHYINEKHAFGFEQGLLAATGEKPWSDVVLHPGRSSITSAVIGFGIDTWQIATREIRPGDTYLLASDGIEVVDSELLRRLVGAFRDAGQPQALNALIQAIDAHGRYLEKGQHDNATLVMVHCEADTAAEEENEDAETVQTSARMSARTPTEDPAPEVRPAKERQSRRGPLLAVLLLLVAVSAIGAYLFLGRQPADIGSFLERTGSPDDLQQQ